jgi:hypothetical protein
MGKARLSPEQVAQRLERLEVQQTWVARVLETYGIRGVWLSPAKAALY